MKQLHVLVKLIRGVAFGVHTDENGNDVLRLVPSLVDSCCDCLKACRTDIRTIGKAKVDQSVFTLERVLRDVLVLVGDEFERAACVHRHCQHAIARDRLFLSQPVIENPARQAERRERNNGGYSDDYNTHVYLCPLGWVQG